MDVSIPATTGLEAPLALRADRHDIPIYALTAHARDGNGFSKLVPITIANFRPRCPRLRELDRFGLMRSRRQFRPPRGM